MVPLEFAQDELAHVGRVVVGDHRLAGAFREGHLATSGQRVVRVDEHHQFVLPVKADHPVIGLNKAT